MKLILTPQTLPDVESANVIGDIKGSEHPEQVIVVSGHLDSWDLGTGAIDDGCWRRSLDGSGEFDPKTSSQAKAHNSRDRVDE